MTGRLQGKVAIVTGAGRGIGREEALLLAREGASVVVNDFDAGSTGSSSAAVAVVDEIIGFGGTAVANGADVSDWVSAAELVDTAVETFGRLDILVNNAGIVRDRMSFNTDEADWDAVVAVNLKGHFAPTRFAAAHWRAMAKSGTHVDASVVCTSSDAGLYGNPGQAGYSAAKAGVAGLTMVLARELASYGVRVNAIAPRARTRMTDGNFDMPADGRFDRWSPANVAPLVAWLSSADARDVTGNIFIVTGGMVAVLAEPRPVGVFRSDSPITPDALTAAKAQLFSLRAPTVGPFAPPLTT